MSKTDSTTSTTDPSDVEAYLTSVDTLTTELSNGLEIEIRDITREEEARISDEAETEDEMIDMVIEEYLVKPDLSPDDLPMSKRQEVFIAIQKEWSGVGQIQQTMDELDVPGNRQRG